MHAITQYRANDGSIWNTADEAEERESLIVAIAEAMKPLGEEPPNEGCRFANGEGYRQHLPSDVVKAKAALIAVSRGPLDWWMTKQDREHKPNWLTVHPSWFCRMLDGGSRPLELAWTRLWRIDSQGREWGQVYFAEHPNEAKGQFEI